MARGGGCCASPPEPSRSNAKARAAGYENWVQVLHFKKDWSLNPELPTLGPWRVVQPIDTAVWVLERNPYYWAVDTAGNQLPYIDRVVLTLAEDLEILNLRAIAGEYDMQERHIDIGKLPVLLENQAKGNYTVQLDLGFNGSDAVLYTDQSFTADPEIAKWLTNSDFCRALSMRIDRDQMNEAFRLGVVIPGSAVPFEASAYNPGPEWRAKWSAFDPRQANALLDLDHLRTPTAHLEWLRDLRPMPIEKMAEAVKAIGADRFIIATDLGRPATRSTRTAFAR